MRSAYENYNEICLTSGPSSQALIEDEDQQLENMILGHPPYTNYTGDFKETLDYIFHSPNLRVLSLLELPSLE